MGFCQGYEYVGALAYQRSWFWAQLSQLSIQATDWRWKIRGNLGQTSGRLCWTYMEVTGGAEPILVEEIAIRCLASAASAGTAEIDPSDSDLSFGLVNPASGFNRSPDSCSSSQRRGLKLPQTRVMSSTLLARNLKWLTVNTSPISYRVE